MKEVKKVDYLESLRGIGAMIVVLHHFGNMFFPAISNGKNAPAHHPFELIIHDTMLSGFFNGNLAVCIFFVVGGFALSYKFFVKNASHNIVGSVIKRYLRLSIPVFVSVLLVYFLMRVELLFHREIMETTKSYWTITFWQFPANFLEMTKLAFYDTFVNGENKYLIILWTMPIEFISSVALYLLIPFTKNRIIRIIVYVAALIFFYKTYYLAFLLGIMACDYYAYFRSKIDSQKNRYQNVIALIGLAIGIWLGTTPQEQMPILQNYVLRNIIAATLIVLAVIHSKTLKSLLSLKVFQFLGNLSFPIYLTHLLILVSFSAYFFNQIVTPDNYLFAALSTFFASLGAIIAIAYIFGITADRFAVKVSTLVSKKLSNKL